MVDQFQAPWWKISILRQCMKGLDLAVWIVYMAGYHTAMFSWIYVVPAYLHFKAVDIVSRLLGASVEEMLASQGIVCYVAVACLMPLFLLGLGAAVIKFLRLRIL